MGIESRKSITCYARILYLEREPYLTVERYGSVDHERSYVLNIRFLSDAN